MEQQRHGWRAIIYDAPWARFKPGQIGVIISEDGRSCETSNDDKSSIVIEVDPNYTTSDRSNGHVLFRQKGSDLYDIVCLSQEGSTYELSVEFHGSICENNIDNIREFLSVFEKINDGEWKETSNYTVINQSTIVSDKKVIVESNSHSETTAETNVIITEDTCKTEINHSVCRIPSASSCEITGGYKLVPNKSSDCNGGEVFFSIEKIDSLNCEGGIVQFCAKTTQETDFVYILEFTRLYKSCTCSGEITGGIITNISYNSELINNVEKVSDNVYKIIANNAVSKANFSFKTNNGIEEENYEITFSESPCTNS
jgi:hypothetical protein